MRGGEANSANSSPPSLVERGRLRAQQAHKKRETPHRTIHHQPTTHALIPLLHLPSLPLPLLFFTTSLTYTLPLKSTSSPVSLSNTVSPPINLIKRRPRNEGQPASKHVQRLTIPSATNSPQHTHNTFTMASSLDHQAFGKTRAEWLSNLNTEYKPPREFRRTSIICTIGMSGR